MQTIISDYEFKSMVDGYLVCMLWIMPGDDDNENPGDDKSIHCDLGANVRNEAELDCAAFVAKCGELASEAIDRMGPASFGNDYALTRNGHGAGYWDREELRDDCLGRKLSDLCRHDECNLYVGSDGKCYFE